jgi:hypothetical protein
MSSNVIQTIGSLACLAVLALPASGPTEPAQSIRHVATLQPHERRTLRRRFHPGRCWWLEG